MPGQRFPSPEDAFEAFRNHAWGYLSRSGKTNTNDGRTSKHSEYCYAKKCQTFLRKCQVPPGNIRNMVAPKCM